MVNLLLTTILQLPALLVQLNNNPYFVEFAHLQCVLSSKHHNGIHVNISPHFQSRIPQQIINILSQQQLLLDQVLNGHDAAPFAIMCLNTTSSALVEATSKTTLSRQKSMFY